MNSALQRIFYRYGWDTRSRNLLPARILGPILRPLRQTARPALLDVGCGYPGIASMFPDVSVTGVDLEAPAATPPNLKFQIGSVMALPFEDKSFPVVTCIDVLEHLSVENRRRAIGEIVRVASKAVLIACPHGSVARACDEEFRSASLARGRPLPSWVDEHLQNSYPDSRTLSETLTAAVRESDRSANLSTKYCESATVCRLVRGAAARSNVLYAFANVLFGSLLPLFPLPDRDNSYRVVLLAEFGDRSGSAGVDR